MAFAQPSYSVPGVYRRPHVRATSFPRLRTDVLGLVGVAGPNYINEAVPVDDWRSFLGLFLHDAKGRPIDEPAGSRLASTVREFFANGGSRCWVVNVAERIVPENRQRLLNDMLGLNDQLDRTVDRSRTGLELLLRQEEVALIVLPELDATYAYEEVPDPVEVPGNPCFAPCRNDLHSAPATRPKAVLSERPLFEGAQGEQDILWAQRYLIQRLQKERWRWFAILSTPPGKNPAAATRWREQLGHNLDDCDVAGLYWPWLLTQEVPGAATTVRSPVGFVAGIFARRDRERGPHVAPANAPLLGVVGLEHRVDDSVNASVYDAGVNIIRDRPGRGIYLWGARTLLWRSPDSRFEALSFVNARRCLSAIARTAYHLGHQNVFEPNNAILRAQVVMVLFGYLMDVYASGALKGDTPEQAFYIKCDSENNTPAMYDNGELVCDIGVALVAPAEFIVFRVGRRNAVTEIAEAV